MNVAWRSLREVFFGSSEFYFVFSGSWSTSIHHDRPALIFCHRIGEEREAMPSIIGNQAKVAFCLFMEGHMGAGEIFQDLSDFLHYQYFPRVAFGPVYLAGHKTHISTDSLEMVGFTGGAEGLRPSVKHRERAMNWKEPTTREELEAIIWITPFLRKT